ncbi:MAG: Bax inhibitor-1 family protein [Breznakia sp.]
MEIYEQHGQENQNGITLRTHMIHSFLWMFAGIAVTFLVAVGISLNSELQYQMMSSNFLWMGMMFAQIGVVIALSARISKIKTFTAKILFFVYAILTGVTFSVIGLVYTGETIALAFGLACLFFGSLVVIGYTTKRDLSKIGTLAIAGLMGMIVYGFLAAVFGWSVNDVLYSMIGLLIFIGITAWDVQKMKKIYEMNKSDTKMLKKLSIYSALSLYLDFVNIFLYILRILGSSRD